ncbi:MAG: VOC family protein [Streptosporangiaceae bacterium]
MSDVTESPAPGAPCWIDLGIPDAARAMEFYRAVFGWDYDDKGAEYGGYITALKNGKQVAGLMETPEAAQGAWWGVYFATLDLQDSVRRTTGAGGTVLTPAMDVMNLGRMAILTDAQGARFGLWEAREFIGCELVNEPGALCWSELMTSVPDASSTFYEQALQLETRQIGEGGFDYRLGMVESGPVFGVFSDPGALSPRWTTYLAVDNADEACRTVVAHGGTVVREPADSPFGRFAVVTDPFGAEFAAMDLSKADPSQQPDV